MEAVGARGLGQNVSLMSSVAFRERTKSAVRDASLPYQTYL